jgi:hypothetical protein
MPIDFQEQRIRFESDTGGPRTLTREFEFPSRVRKAVSLINGFHAAFTNSEHPLHRLEINTRAVVDEEDVEVTATFALRDRSGTFDDDYEGFIDVVVLVDRV